MILVSFGRGRELEIDLDPICPLRAKTAAEQIQPAISKSPFKSRVEIAIGQTTETVAAPKEVEPERKVVAIKEEKKKVKKKVSASKTAKQKKPKGKKKVDDVG
jgi:hypothetical protein